MTAEERAKALIDAGVVHCCVQEGVEEGFIEAAAAAIRSAEDDALERAAAAVEATRRSARLHLGNAETYARRIRSLKSRSEP